MLDNCYRIGEGKEIISEAYIKRCLSENIIDIEYFQHVDKNAVYVLNCMSKFDKIKERFSNFNQIRVLKFLSEEQVRESVKNYEITHENDPYHTTLFHTSPILANFVSGADIYISEDECSVKDFEQICKKNPEAEKCHHFRVIDEKKLEWIRSKGDVTDLEEFRIQTTFVEESNLYKSEPETNTNLIIGDPGMGKSELLKNIKNNSMPKVWGIFLDSKDITLLCEHLEKVERQECFNKFVKFILDVKYDNYAALDKAMIRVFLEDHQAAYFWDALDEVPTKDIDIVINLIEDLSLKSSYQWITSRCHLKKQLENKFAVLSRSIRQLDESEQSLYIHKRLKDVIEDEKNITEIIEKIKSTVTLVKHNNILGIPLQIFMLTELFRQDVDKYLEMLKEVFSLTELYHHIIEEKFNLFYQKKANVQSPNDALKKVLEGHKKSMFVKYEKAALKALVTKEVLKRFNINCDDFLKEIQGRDDSIGLITEVTDSFPQFLHNSYAEYFVATYFVEHHKEIPHFEDIIYDKRYANIRFFFDLLTAKDSAAHIGVLYKNFDLIKQCKDVLNSEDKKGRSALQLACSWGQNYPILNVNSDNEVCIVDNENDDSNVGETPEYVEMLQYLLANSNISNYANLSSRCLMAKIEIMSMVLKQNSSIKLKTDTESISIFYYAAKFGYTEVLDMFESVPFIKTKKDSSSLLHVAVTYKQDQFLEKLLNLKIYKKNIDDKDKYGRTSLYKACQNGHVTIVEILVKEGANVDVATDVGCTPLHIASLYSYNGIIELLLSSSLNKNAVKNFGITPLHVASWNGHSSTVDLLINHGVQLNVQADDGCTPLYVSSRNKHAKVVKSLLDNGALADLAQVDDVTPLFIASQEGHEKNVELLLKAGASVNLVTKSGESPLYIACQNGHKSIVKMLLDYGADLNTIANNGWTASKIACQQGHLEIVKILIQNGVTMDEFSLMVARSHGHEDVASFLENILM